MTEMLSAAVVLLLAYVGYLRLQLHIQQRIVSAFQNAAVVVPPAERRRPGASGLAALALLLLSGALCALLARWG